MVPSLVVFYEKKSCIVGKATEDLNYWLKSSKVS